MEKHTKEQDIFNCSKVQQTDLGLLDFGGPGRFGGLGVSDFISDRE